MPMLVAGLATGLACAQTPRSVEPPDVHGRAIELGSRCLESTPSGLANVPLPADAHRAVLPGGLDAVVVASPYAVRESLRISLPRSAFASPSWARAVLLAWSTGELAAEPEALRRAMRAGGVSTRAGLAGDRGFLAFEFPAGRLDDAIAALARLFEATPIGDGPWAVLRPELALLLMAEELAPTTAARRLRQAVEDGPEAARAAGARAALDGLDPATLHAALQRGLATPGVLVAYAAQVGAQFVVRDIRSPADFEYERVMRHLNADLSPDIISVFLMPPREVAEVSSSLVKGLIGPAGWQPTVRKFVPACVYDFLVAHRPE